MLEINKLIFLKKDEKYFMTHPIIAVQSGGKMTGSTWISFKSILVTRAAKLHIYTVMTFI